MSDIALVWKPEDFEADIATADNDLVVSDDLETGIIDSLFTDRRLPAGAAPPSGPEYRGGWWGDSFQETEGDRDGSLLWTLAREKQAPDVLEKARVYARDALQWMTEDGVAERVEVATDFPRVEWLGIYVSVHKPDGSSIAFRYHYNWAAQALKRA